MENEIMKEVGSQAMNEVRNDGNGSILGTAAILLGAATIGNLVAEGIKAGCKAVANWYEDRKKTKGVIEIQATNDEV